MVLAKHADLPPRELAVELLSGLPENSIIKSTEIAGPGFINFHLYPSSYTDSIVEILQAGDAFGRSDTGKGRRLQVEFVSANPTGPLHVGHGRGAAIGDSLSRLLEATGWSVHREFYYNDAGQQIDNLALSVQARAKSLSPGHPNWPKDGYRGDYIKDVAIAYQDKKTIKAADREITAEGDISNIEAIRDFSVAYLRNEQDKDLKAFEVDFDEYFLESSLYKNGDVKDTVGLLERAGHTYSEGGALWFRTTKFGDDKDRVMRKKDGSYTYFVPDVAYHHHKWERGFERVINEQGADHHSTITRVRAGLKGLEAGIPEDWPEYVLHQMVTVMQKGVEVKLSKRAGSYVTLRELIDWVGKDATRYFLVARAPNSQLTFDIDLAKSRSNENPVYYIQYAHARCCGVIAKAKESDSMCRPGSGLTTLDKLTEVEALKLAASLGKFPEVVQNAAYRLEPHDIANYLRQLAGNFHSFYNAHKILEADPETSLARLAIVRATRQVLASGLDLLGVSAPERM